MTSPLRVIFAGSGAFGLPTLASVAPAVVQVISQPDHPAGRGRKLTPTPVAQFAIEKNLPLLRTADINAENLPDADVMIVIAFGQKISQEQARRPRLGSVNLHASLLPRFRGAAPINHAILGGESITGNTIIRLAERMDAGAILGQSNLEIAPTETAGELHDRLAEDGPALLQRVLNDLLAGRADERPQDHALATIAKRLSRADAAIDWTASPDAVSRRIRALWPWPGCHARLLDAAGSEVCRLTLARARPTETEGARWKPGEIETTGAVFTGNSPQGGAIEVLELQPAGKRVMALDDFRRGHGWVAGMRLESV